MVTYLDRAREAARSAREMRNSGDNNGACNRAYYAVFYVALGLFETSDGGKGGKTHASVLREFSRRFVLSGLASPELGRALTIAKSLRSKADYSVAGATAQDADDAIDAMDRLLEFAEPLLASSPKGAAP